MRTYENTRLSSGLVNASILLYTFWLMLPAVQTTGRAVTGAAAVGIFGLGVLLDIQYVKKHWKWLMPCALCVLSLPLVLRVFLLRGGENFAGFYVQQVMFWFPLAFCAYARRRKDPQLYRFLKWMLLGAMAITTLTTIFWLVEGMFFRGDRVYAYARSLGSAEPGREAYLKELMLKNIGGYDFIYATVISMPLTCIGVQHHRGIKRGVMVAFLCAQAVMVVLSQYTYAMIYAAVILMLQLIAALARMISKGRLSMGSSLLIGAIPLALVFLLRMPLVTLAAELCTRLGLTNFAFSFEQLLVALRGGVTDGDSRLGYYVLAAQGFTSSPLIGSMFTSAKQISQHSDILDLLSGVGVIGTMLVGDMIAVIGRGSLKGIRSNPYRAQLLLMLAVLLVASLFGTVVYSRDIMLVVALGILLVLEPDGRSPQKA